MINKKSKEEDANLIGKTPALFVEYYNENIPDSFPRATLKILAEYQARYPSLFKENGEWIVNKHRKKFMDWLSSYREPEKTV